MMRRSITLRLSVTFASVSLFVFTLVGVGLFIVMEKQLFAELRATLDTRTKLAEMVVSHATAAHWPLTEEKLTVLTPVDGSTRYQVASDDPAIRFGAPFASAQAQPANGAYQKIREPASGYDVLTKTILLPANSTRPALKLVVATSCERTQRLLLHFRMTLALLIAAATIVTLFLGRAVARFGLAPLTRLSTEAAQLSPAHRRQRLPTLRLPRELHHLATAFNGALERIEHAYDRLESFNADVAHELRTPVSILLGQTQVALTGRQRSVEQLRQTLQSNLEEFERLRIIINDMLFLSRSDRGEQASDLSDVSLASEVARTLHFLEILFDEANLRVKLTGDACAFVDPSLFRRALTNLLINAIQHSPPGATVGVSLEQHGDGVNIAVSNPGEPIALSSRRHLFERFYRLEEARANSQENHGLGLAIVKAVAEMHGGSVFVSCQDGINTLGFSVAGYRPRTAAAAAVAAGLRATS